MEKNEHSQWEKMHECQKSTEQCALEEVVEAARGWMIEDQMRLERCVPVLLGDYGGGATLNLLW